MVNIHGFVFSQCHDGTFAKVFFNLGNCHIQCFFLAFVHTCLHSAALRGDQSFFRILQRERNMGNLYKYIISYFPFDCKHFPEKKCYFYVNSLFCFWGKGDKKEDAKTASSFSKFYFYTLFLITRVSPATETRAASPKTSRSEVPGFALLSSFLFPPLLGLLSEPGSFLSPFWLLSLSSLF